jgi:DNA-directed RNA polymerase subunit RPC12/RpoP
MPDAGSVITCPDCGGVVGAREVTEHGPPCRCFVDAPRRAPVAPLAPVAPPAPVVEPRLDADDRAGTGAPTTNGTALAGTPGADTPDTDASDNSAATEKRCALCGKNVAGHRRLKDSRGYICLDCARAEAAQQKPQGIKCPKCFRVVKEESLGEFDGQKVCQRCLREARELARPGSKRFRKIDTKHHEEHKKTQLIVLSAVAGVLLILMLIGWLRG